MKYNKMSTKTLYTEDLTRMELINMVHQLRSTLLIVLNSVPTEVIEENGHETSISLEEVNLARKILGKTDIK